MIDTVHAISIKSDLGTSGGPAVINMNIQDLPPEIILLLFDNLLTAKDIYSLIRSSSRFRNTFNQHRKVILVHFASKIFHPRLLPLAVTICTVDGNTCLEALRRAKGIFLNGTCWVTDESLLVKLRSTCIGHKHEYLYADHGSNSWENGFQCGNMHELLSHNDSTSESLCHLWNLLHYFTADYYIRSVTFLKNAKQKGGPKVDRYPPSRENALLVMTESEVGRLQRALLYFELHCRTFGEINYSHLHNTKERMQFFRFLDNAELLQLWSVRCYLTDRFLSVFDEIDMFLTQNLERMIVKGERPCGESYGPVAKMARHATYILQTSGKADREGLINYLMQLGLPFCKTFLQMDVREQALVAQTACFSYKHSPQDFLGDPIRRYKYNPNDYTNPFFTRVEPNGLFPYNDIRKYFSLLYHVIDHDNLGLSGIFIWDREADIKLSAHERKDEARRLRRRIRTKFKIKKFAGKNVREEDLKDIVPDQPDEKGFEKLLRALNIHIVHAKQSSDLLV